MTDTFCTMVIPAAWAPLARALAKGLSAAGVGMFETPLSPTGELPPTHYCSTGMIRADIADLLGNADRLHAACVAAGAPVTRAQCRAMVSASDVTAEQPFSVFARLGLQLASDLLPGELPE